MESFLIDLVTETKIKRQLELLNLLQTYNYPIPIEALAGELKVTPKTVQKDLTELKSFTLKDQILLEESKVGVQLSPDSKNLPLSIFQQLTEQSLSFTLLDTLFTEKSITLEELEERYFISETTLKRHLTKLRRILKKHRLTIKMHPVRFESTEANIRYFFMHYFYASKCWRNSYRPSSEHKESVAFLAQKLSDELGITLLFEREKLTYWVMVQDTRMRNNFMFQDEKLVANQKYLSSHFPAIKEIYITTQKKYYPQLTFSEDELLYTYAVGLDSIAYKDYLFGNPNIASNELAFAQRMLDLGKEIAECFNTEFQKAPLFFHALENYFIITLFLNQVTPLFQKNDDQLTSFIRSEHPKTYGRWMNFFAKSSTVQFFNIEFFEDVCATLTIYTVLYLYEENADLKNVLFSFRGDHIFIEYLCMIIGKAFAGIHTLFQFNEDATTEILEENKIDILITNYHLSDKFENVKQQEISAIPTMEEWQQLRQLIIAAMANDYRE